MEQQLEYKPSNQPCSGSPVWVADWDGVLSLPFLNGLRLVMFASSCHDTSGRLMEAVDNVQIKPEQTVETLGILGPIVATSIVA